MRWTADLGAPEKLVGWLDDEQTRLRVVDRWRTEEVGFLQAMSQAMSFPACAAEGHKLGAAKREGRYSNRSCFCGWQKESSIPRRRGQDVRGTGRRPRRGENSTE